MLKIFLLRHGETTYNADNNRYCGRTDIPLTEKGVKQAEEVKRQLEGIEFTAVYSSPLQRAYTTAKIASGKDPIKDERLIEADFGTWEAKTKEEFIAENESLWLDWMHNPAIYRAGGTGETGAEIVARVDDFFQSLQQTYSEGNIMVVAHNGINRLFMAHKLGMPLKNYRQLVQQNSSITCFTLDKNGTLTLELLNSKLR
ncbi:histidine phosphatase family protein [Pseudobacter ginsenosidimutans]|uniref:Alpha-ribazole phosphatase/probable phosphoglycerate mutase n=1 Tax=Pseudobacter ginsenosidimutans TaxID=661488 RepID=A0A4Q7MUP4_9BACT|nr:histidine phosphatase family protein [Pseudobacter ginsenosidimutans]QEC41528.1 histidine phosphatase family protein [Pseudobacter ginsenosidimutans]RZS71689.1 alpha-ribazole phosphatase/probable phosphoglycerate mutase [Pseudobacter ginsenosidimutans]